MFDNIDMLEFDKYDYEHSQIKNTFIRNTDKEFITYINKNETNIDEISDFFCENPLYENYDIIIFGEDVPEYETDFHTLIQHLNMNIFSFTYKRSLMKYTGCFNEHLTACSNFEFLCRLTQYGKVCCIPCKSECVSDTFSNATDNMAFSMAYIIRYNYEILHKANTFNNIFLKYITYASQHNILNEFNHHMSDFLTNDEKYRNIERNTCPFLIVTSNDMCFGVIKDFSTELTNELANLGQAIDTIEIENGLAAILEKLHTSNWKGIIGFQAPFLENANLHPFRIPKFQYWFDNPAFFNKDMFNYTGDDYYILCHDKYYNDYLKNYYGMKNPIVFPPAGTAYSLFNCDEKKYDVVFIGSFKLNKLPDDADEFKQAFFTYMDNNPTLTFDEGLKNILKGHPILEDKEKYKELFAGLAHLCHVISGHHRTKVIETILNAGIKLHVFGDSWKSYNGEFKDNLIIHPDVSVEESLKVMSQAKISLNVMHWHKAGMTERIANSMLTGAVCLSDETTYLKENFTEDEIVLYELNHLEELPGKIQKILSDDDYRKRLAHNAYSKAVKEHTWKQRAEKLLELTELFL